MLLALKRRIFGKRPANVIPFSLGRGPQLAPSLLSDLAPTPETALVRTIAWISAGATALAIGLFIGRELRGRYKFNRRTPYDIYAHAGDSQEFGVGI